MAHGDAVTDADGVELKGDAARLGDALLHPLTDLVQMAMTRDDLHIRVTDRDKRLLEIIALHARRHKQSAMRSPLKSTLHLVAIHDQFLSSSFKKLRSISLPSPTPNLTHKFLAFKKYI